MAMTEIGEKTLEQEREETQENDMLLVFQSLVAQEKTNKFLFARQSALENRIMAMEKCEDKIITNFQIMITKLTKELHELHEWVEEIDDRQFKAHLKIVDAKKLVERKAKAKRKR